MKILGMDTSGQSLSLGVAVEGTPVFEITELQEKRFTERIYVLLEKVLVQCRLEIGDIDAFAINTGPGSFTGVRVGVASVKGFAHSLDKPVISVSAFEVVFEQVQESGRKVCAVVPYKRDKVTYMTMSPETELPGSGEGEEGNWETIAGLAGEVDIIAGNFSDKEAKVLIEMTGERCSVKPLNPSGGAVAATGLRRYMLNPGTAAETAAGIRPVYAYTMKFRERAGKTS